MKYTVIVVFKWPNPNESVVSRYGGMERGGRGTATADKEENCPTIKEQMQGGEVHCVKVELILENIERKKQNTSLVRNNCSMVQCVNPATSVDGGKVLRKVKEPSMTFQPYKVQLSGWGWRDRRKKRIVFLVIGQAWRSSAGKGSSFRCTSPPHLYDGWIPQRYSLLTFSLRLQSSELWYNSQQRLQPKTSISNVMICMKWSARTRLCARHTSAPSRIYSQVCLVLIFTLKYHSFVYSPKKDDYLQQINVLSLSAEKKTTQNK